MQLFAACYQAVALRPGSMVPGTRRLDQWSLTGVKMRDTDGTTSIAHASSGAWLCLERVLERRWQDEQEITFLGRARLFNFLFPGFPAICYFQAKIISSILGSFVRVVCLHASASVPFSGMHSPSPSPSRAPMPLPPGSTPVFSHMELIMQSAAAVMFPLPHREALQVKDCVIPCLHPT